MRTVIDSNWKVVKGFKTHEFMVYSAYYDARNTNKPHIRVFGVTRSINPEKVLCRLFYDYNQENFETKHDNNNIHFMNDDAFFRDVNGKISLILNEAHLMMVKMGLDFVYTPPKQFKNDSYHSCDITCPLYDPKNPRLANKRIPVAISILPRSSPGSLIDYKLPVLNSENGGTGTYVAAKNEVGLCVKPIHSNYDDWVELVSFIELNKILGVSKFIVYNESISENVNCVLKYYEQKENIVTILSWDLVTKFKNKNARISNRGVMSSLNDCFYRNMNEYQYLFSVDLDEFIIPHMHETLPEMLKYLHSTDVKYLDRHARQKYVKNNIQNTTNSNIITSYNFLNGFFYHHDGKSFTVSSCEFQRLQFFANNI